MADVIVTARKNGPYMVQGTLELLDAEGNKVELKDDPIFLCRCGASANKPFCDGTHRNNGFEG
ncbi:MAG: CDGSH iron-sulfur domain-containing protein [Chloroflexi bacterium]|nr:CDGSH iron-sulfur domain-containing protein [Chloroflexota bacterium]